MRSRATFFTLLFTVSFFALPLFAHASIPFFGPIIPEANPSCPASWGMLVTVINNIIELLITLAIAIVAPLMIAYSGFLFVVNPVNAGGKEQAKKILQNTIVGIVIALAAWMIVAAIMAVLYHSPDGTWGTWESLIVSGGTGNDCLVQAGSTAVAPTEPAPVVPAPVGKAPGTCAPENHACGTTWIQLMAQTLNMNLSDAQKNALSCIAMTESSGNPNTPDSPTGACGTFQITNRTVNSNWQNPAYHTGQCTVASSCNDAQCNLQTALILARARGYQPWTGKKSDGTYWNPNAVACVQKFDPNNTSFKN